MAHLLDVTNISHYINVMNLYHEASSIVMKIHRPSDLAGLIREARSERGWTQAELAKRLEVSRRWIIRLESGESGMAIGIVLRALNELGFELQVSDNKTETTNKSSKPKRSGVPISIDEVVDE